MRKLLKATLIFTLINGSVMAQGTINKFEIELNKDFEDYKVVTFEEKEIVIYGINEKAEKGKSAILITKLDNSYKIINSTTFSYSKKMSLVRSVKTNNKIYFLFHETRGAANFIMLEYDVESGTFKDYNNKIDSKLYIKYFAIINDKALIYGWKSAAFLGLATPHLYIFDLKNQTISSIKQDEVAYTLLPDLTNFILGYKNLDDSFELHFYDNNGQKNNEVTLKSESTIFESLILNRVGDDSFIVNGVYEKNKTQGYYFAKLNKSKFEELKLYKFYDFENFFSFLGEKDKERINKKIDKNELKGDELKSNYKLFLHHPIKINGQYIIIGEAYFETYRYDQVLYNETDKNGRMVSKTKTVKVFDGYEYTHAVIACFDEYGNKLWDNCFALKLDDKPLNFKAYVLTVVDNNKLKICYPSSDKIFMGTISEGKINDLAEYTTSSQNENDSKSNSTFQGLTNWYGNKFIYYSIKEENSKQKEKIMIFQELIIN